MVLYVILFFVATCIGMAISVYAFGTGGKRKKIFQDIYFSVEDTDGIGVLYTKTGEYSAILKMENPVQKYSANIDSYYEFTNLFASIAQTLGEGYALHKQDIFTRKESLADREKPVPRRYSMEPEDCYTIGEICNLYHINDSSVWAHIRKYSIPSRQIGNYVYVAKEEIDNLYKSEVE